MKTPEEMASEYCDPILSDNYAREIGRLDWIGTICVRAGPGHELFRAFLAGYQAARTTINKDMLLRFMDYCDWTHQSRYELDGENENYLDRFLKSEEERS